MKKTAICLLILTALILAPWLAFWRHQPQVGPVPVAEKQPRPQQPANRLSDAARKELQPTTEEMEVMLDSPVEFYGKVVDENDRPMVGIEITCSWPFMTSMDELVLKSAAPDGRFEVTGRKAHSMQFIVKRPPGYLDTETSAQEFQFAENPERLKTAYAAMGQPAPVRHQPDKSNPVVFRLRKVAPSDALYHASQGRGQIKRDGTPQYFSLSAYSAKALAEPPAHAVELRLISDKDPLVPNKGVPLSWSIRIRIPGGGLQALTEKKNPVSGDYDSLMAPENGYQEEVFFDFPDSSPTWKVAVNQEFFIRFPDKTYGRATIYGSWDSFRIESYLNPTGSRNLLLDESKAIELNGAR